MTYGTRDLLRASSILVLFALTTTSAGAQSLGGAFERRYTFDGALRGESFGQSVAGAGDVNLDGFDDLIVGAPGRSFAVGGIVFVVSGKDGTKLWQVEGFDFSDLGYTIGLGTSVAGAGDVNGDGTPDVIVGSPDAQRFGLPNTGIAQVLSGTDGTLLWEFPGLGGFYRMGGSVDGAGDVNRDGFADVIVGASSVNADFAYVFSGKDGTTIWRFAGLPGQALGHSVGAAGDVNRDGFPDLIVGAPSEWLFGGTGYGLDEGAAYIYSGRTSVPLRRFTGGGLLGFAVDGAGDVNQDGFVDVIVGAPATGQGGQEEAGAAYVYSGRDGTTLWEFQGESAGTRLGRSVAGAGDVNQDGFADVLVGASVPGSFPAAYADLHSGKDGTLLWRFDEASGVRFVDGAGDVNNDGFPDVIVGDAGSDPGGVALAGAAYVYVYQHMVEPALLRYGTGLAGSGGLTPRIGTDGMIPHVGSTDFEIELEDTRGGAQCIIAVSLVRREQPLLGGTLYGDFLTPGVFMHWMVVSDGTTGSTGLGTATLRLQIPNDPSIVGLTTYWQGFAADRESPLQIGVTHTAGLAVTVVQ